jgi:hypothetical protein
LLHPDLDLTRLQDLVSLRCDDYERSLLAHLRAAMRPSATSAREPGRQFPA